MSDDDLAALVDAPTDLPGPGVVETSNIVDRDPLLPGEVLSPTRIGRFTVLSVEEASETLNWLIFGDSGVGKTRLAASACRVPELAPVLVIDCEGGVSSIKHLYPEVGVLRAKSWEELQEIYNDLYDDNGQTFKTVVVDSITEIQKFSMAGVMRLLTSQEPDRDPDIPGLREWGKNIEQTRRFIRAMRDLPVNTVFTALRMDDRNQRTGVTTIQPSLSGKLAKEVSAFIDEVLYMYVKNIGDGEYARLLLTRKTEEVIAKDRSDNLPMVVQDPDFQLLYEYITHQRDANAPAQAES